MIDELKHLYKAYVVYKRGFTYTWMRFFVAPRILKRLQPLDRDATNTELSIHMLFGKRDFLMAVWSLASWYRVAKMTGKLFLHSDGTLTEREKGILYRLFPHAVLIDANTVMPDVREIFEKYPELIRFRERYTKFQSKKLIDQYLYAPGEFRLLLDSDMLWFRNPHELEQSLSEGIPHPLMMSNGETLVHVENKEGKRISDHTARYNSGIVLYRKSQFNLDRFDSYVREMDWEHKRFTNQACFASVFEHPLLLPSNSYIIKGTLTDRIVVRHYTSPSRTKFYCYGLNFIWKDILT